MVRWQISAILGVAAAVAVTAAALITRTADIAVDLGTRAGQVLAGEATVGPPSTSAAAISIFAATRRPRIAASWRSSG